ncbi:hypothetical protein V1264_020620 [Littorina saxatilis]|uniref:Reverse transcriptase zinc-binding domain-containing protein n=1 Tax=Littorina saxatilis TaxID=31220 RepID=A0AAN9BC64_9CAEN
MLDIEKNVRNLQVTGINCNIWLKIIPSRKKAFLFHVRTGHCRLNAHMFRKLKLTPSPTCPCGLEDQTPEHVLMTCPQLKPIRDKVWPASVPLRTKLYGSRQDLEATTSFVSQTKLMV